MGMMDYALAGAVKGGADTFLEISKEERAEKREVKKEKRVAGFQDIRDRRLAELRSKESKLDREGRTEEARLDRDARTEEGRIGREFTASENRLTRRQQTKERVGGEGARSDLQDDAQDATADLQDDSQDHGTAERQATTAGRTGDIVLANENAVVNQDDQQEHQRELQESSQDFKQSQQQASDAQSVAEIILKSELENQRMTLSYGQVVVDTTDPNKPKVVYQAGDKPITTGVITPKVAGAFFSSEAKAYYGKLDQSGLTNFGTDRQARLAKRASALSMRVWEAEGGRVSPNEVFARVFDLIGNQKDALDPEATLDQLEEAVDNADDFWSQDFSSTSPEEAQEIEQLEGAYNTNKKTLEEDLTVRPGMLNTATQEKTVLPPETAKLLKEGVVTSFSNGQKWTLKRGQPVQVQ